MKKMCKMISHSRSLKILYFDLVLSMLFKCVFYRILLRGWKYFYYNKNILNNYSIMNQSSKLNKSYNLLYLLNNKKVNANWTDISAL
jgi:uncharacterized membrane protein SpoIIM required for sporulation